MSICGPTKSHQSDGVKKTILKLCIKHFQGLPWLNQKWTTPEVIQAKPLDDFFGLKLQKFEVSSNR